MSLIRSQLEDEDETLILFISIDHFTSGSNEEINKELNLENDLVKTLLSASKEIKSEYKGILIFDGYDSARDDIVRNNFYKLIKNCIHELYKWNVIVSIRKFDAKKNIELLYLFDKNNSDKEYTFCVYFGNRGLAKMNIYN